jgi:hypothetical protein
LQCNFPGRNGEDADFLPEVQAFAAAGGLTPFGSMALKIAVHGTGENVLSVNEHALRSLSCHARNCIAFVSGPDFEHSNRHVTRLKNSIIKDSLTLKIAVKILQVPN